MEPKIRKDNTETQRRREMKRTRNLLLRKVTTFVEIDRVVVAFPETIIIKLRFRLSSGFNASGINNDVK
jgi:hypothetical protein